MAAEAKDEDSHAQGGERVTSRYDTPGNVEAQFEPGSGGCVLANKLGIADPKEMVRQVLRGASGTPDA